MLKKMTRIPYQVFALLAMCDVTYAAILAPPNPSEIPGDPAFISKAGTSPLYANYPVWSDNDGELLTKFEITDDKAKAADEPRGVDNYRYYPLPADAAKYLQRTMERSNYLEVIQCGLAINPFGGSAPSGRGFYWNWGANLAADPLVTRYGRPNEYGVRNLELLVVQRPKKEWQQDNEGNLIPMWALPGGMLDTEIVLSPGLLKQNVRYETSKQGAIREAGEETGLNFAPLEDLFKVVYRGYVNDPRATKHSWPETVVQFLHVHDDYRHYGVQFSAEQITALNAIRHSERLAPLDATEVPDARWMIVSEENVNALFASHGLFVRMAMQQNPLPLSITE